MIEEVHGKPVKAGESFSAAHIVGFFDSIEAVHRLSDRHKGYTVLQANQTGRKQLMEPAVGPATESAWNGGDSSM